MATKTRNMNLDKPTPGTGPGADSWSEAVNLQNQNLDKIGDHDHSPGKGVPVTPAGLNINQDLSIEGKGLRDIGFAEYDNTSASQAPNNSFFRIGDRFYYKNSAGVSINILNFIPSTEPHNLISQIVTLAGNTSLDTLGGATALAENHIYILQAGLDFTNVPSDFDNTLDYRLIVLTDNSQFLNPLYGGLYYKRVYGSGAWGSWTKLEGTSTGGGGGETLTSEQIKTLYELNADTNAFTDSEKTRLGTFDFNLPPADLHKHITFVTQEHTDASNSFVTLTTASGGVFNQTHAPLSGSISPALPILTYASFNNIQNGQIILYFDRTLMDAAFTRIPNWVKIHLGSRTINLPNATNIDAIFGYEYKTFAQGNMDAYIGRAISNVRFEFPGNVYYPTRTSESNVVRTTTKNDLEAIISADLSANKANTDLQNVRDDLTDTQKETVRTRISSSGIIPEVSNTEAILGTSTSSRLWSPLRVNQAISALSSGGTDVLVSGNSQDPPNNFGVEGQLLFRTTDSTLWFKTGGIWHVVGRVPIEVTQAEAEAGTLTEVRHWTPQRVNQAIQALSPSGGTGGTAVTANPSGTDGNGLDRLSIGGTNYNISGGISDDFINDLNIGSLDKDSEFVFNKHIPASPHYLYSTNQQLSFQRDGVTTTYDINLPPPDAPRREATIWGSAGTQVHEQIWSARLSATTNGFMSFDLRHQGEAQPQMLEFESEETGAFKGTFPTNEHTDSASVTFLNNSYPTEHWRRYFFLEYFFKNNNVQPGFVPTHLVFFDSDGAVEIELPLQRDNPDGDDLLSYWYWTSTAVTTNYTEAQLEALRMDIRVQNGTYLFHRPDPTGLFTSTDISTLNNNAEVTLDKINRVDLGQDDADKNFYLQGHKRVHNSNNYLRLTLFNDADLSDQAGINDLRPDGYVASPSQGFLINFKSEDKPSESQNRKTTLQSLATDLSEVLTPRERRLQNELNILSQITSQLSISGRSPTETVAITNGLALFSERPTAAVMQAASYATTVPHAVTNEHNFIGLKLSFDTDKNRTQILITEDGQTIPESLFNGGALTEVATTDANFAYYYIELRHPLQLEGTLSATINTSQVIQTEFTGRTRHPFRVTSLPLASADYEAGEVIRLINPQAPFQGEASITFGDNGLYYGYATRAIPNFVTEDIGSSSISLDSSLYGILVEKTDRSQIYVIGNGSDFTNSLTHLLVGQTSYPLSSSVMVSGTTHFKIVEDGNGNPLRDDASPLNDITENDTRDISVRRVDNEYIGGATPTFEVGNYERQITTSTDLDDIWSPVALLHTTAEKARDYEFMLENLSNHYRKDRDIPGARLFLNHTRGFSDETLGNLLDVPSEFPDEIHVMTWHNDISNSNEYHRFKIEVVEDSGESNRAYHGKTFVFNGREHTLSYYQRSNNRNRYHTSANSQSSDPGSNWRNVNIENVDFEAHEAFQDARAWIFHRGE